MPLRVTNNMLGIQLMRNLNNNMRRMDGLQEQLATGRRINKPSDDPVGITYSLRYRSELDANEQFQSNVDNIQSWLDYTDSSLNQANEVLQIIREKLVKASNGSNPSDALASIKKEMIQYRGQLIDIGNAKLGGKYIFNGQKTDLQPYTDTNAATASTDAFGIQMEATAGVKIPVNVTGNDVFGYAADTDNIFKVLDGIMSDLDANNFSGLSSSIAEIDSRMDKLLSVRAEIGARTNRVELIGNRLSSLGINLETLQGKVEDADMAELITRLKIDESIYQASLSVGSKIIQPSLVDFLR